MTVAAAGVRRLARGIRRWYGASPLHLLALLAAFALAGYALRGVIEAGQWRGFAEWFVVAIIGHDLLLFPLYSLADLSLRGLLPARLSRRRPVPPAAAESTGARPTRVESAAARSTSAGPTAPRPAHPVPTAKHTTGWDHLTVPARPASHAPTEATAAGPAQTEAMPATAGVAGPPLINYVRIPVAFSLLLLMVFFPLILRLSQPQYHRASGLSTQPYLWRWLAITGVMFAISAVTYALRLRRMNARLSRRS
jgi:hypothetical protein